MQWKKYEQIIYDNRCDNILLFALNIRGGSWIFESGSVQEIKSAKRTHTPLYGIKVCGFALLILSLFVLISHENEIIWSQ